MSPRRIGILFQKELTDSSKSYFLIFAIVGPLTFTLLVHLVFGSFFAGRPELGINDRGGSIIVESLREMNSIDLREYSSERELKEAVESGARDIGIVLPEGFDARLGEGDSTRITAYIWGESLLKNRIAAGAAFIHQARAASGRNAPVDIVPVPLGEKENVPWQDRFLPLIVLMAIFIAGFAVPATSLVEEKEKKTIVPVLTTPVTQSEIFIAKGMMGLLASVTMGITILFLNHAFNAQLGLLIVLTFMGALMACCIGLILGALMTTTGAIYSTIKGMGPFLYGPGLVALFPRIPSWIAKLFPTYYVINPIMELSRKGGGWSTIRQDVYILGGIIAVFMVLVIITGKARPQEA
ncbi:MAG: ABC transporter permease [Candidatus Krumholzibacteriota bacterium]|nr:ABC transporter permease [Candidatus Krumholzibacteriota bacterium]